MSAKQGFQQDKETLKLVFELAKQEMTTQGIPFEKGIRGALEDETGYWEAIIRHVPQSAEGDS